MADIYENQSSSGRIGEILQRRKWIGISAFLFIFVPAIVFLWSLPNMYAATATLTVSNPGNIDSYNFSGNENSLPFNAVTTEVLSRRNLEKIISELKLFTKLKTAKHVSPAALADMMRKNVKIEKQQIGKSIGRPRTIAFTVSYNGWNPDTAAVVANRLAKSYLSTAGKMRVKQAMAQAAALSSSMAVIRKKLEQQQAGIEKFSNAHLGALPQQQQLIMTTLTRLYNQLQAVQSRQLEAIQKRSNLLESINSIEGPNLVQLQKKLNSLRLQYTDKYPEIVELKRQISALENQKTTNNINVNTNNTSPLKNQLTTVDTNLRQLEAKEKNIQSQIKKYRNRLNMLPITGQRLQAMNQQIGQTSAVYTSLLKQYDQARIAAVTGGANNPPFSILESALPPTGHIGPKRLRLALMFFLLGVAAAFVVMMLVEKRDATFHTLDELRKFTSVPILATVPVMRRKGEDFKRTIRLSVVALAVVFGVSVLSGGAYMAGHGNQFVAQKLSSHVKT